ncbi:glycosyltransferase family 2 protein [Pararcticibacter amylolyticus]|uniref:Family 2 glycosyl transferase n=1 Tax=Pararcticibacter amylolyticus TaxID=2173175 RepID=A0A2U2PI37_9SPHI|nr:glycosyltransferase [Pararcticibacter amylolyticus]PWG81076.1 family 2 glycosyl transferase [Pararcticibacter amylolyticus]
MLNTAIESQKRTSNDDDKFSILIPSWNNLNYLKLCIESIRKNSFFKHQIIVHINCGDDGTLEWIKEQSSIDYTYSSENVGVCYALNASSQLAHTDYILFINDDMYVCPEWDLALWEEIVQIGHPLFFLSATAIEPKASSICSIEKNYGTDVSNFDENRLLAEFTQFEKADWNGATWPPNIVHKKLWNLVGGYSIEFSPGMYSDPDFSMKLWLAGVRLFKGVSRSRVYHFGSVSVKRVKKNAGYYQFISKWGITSGTFTNAVLKRGRDFKGLLAAPRMSWALRTKGVYKQVVSLFNRPDFKQF